MGKQEFVSGDRVKIRWHDKGDPWISAIVVGDPPDGQVVNVTALMVKKWGGKATNTFPTYRLPNRRDRILPDSNPDPAFDKKRADYLHEAQAREREREEWKQSKAELRERQWFALLAALKAPDADLRAILEPLLDHLPEIEGGD